MDITSSAPIHIIADDREWQSDIHFLLEQNPEVNFKIQRLQVGDFKINEQLIAERKTIIDFALSIQNGRLWSQLIRMANLPQTKLLILEGNSHQMTKTGLTRESMQGALNYITLFLGIHLLRTENPLETAQLMIFAGQKMNAIKTPAKISFPKIKRKCHPLRNQKDKFYFLCNIQGIGLEKARNLLNHFGSIKAIFNADLKEIASVKGIGKKLAENILKVAN